jgi:membrane associated rhomboid family serine protease
VALLDDILRLLGTNRTRMQWKVRAWRRAWDRRVGSLKNRAQAVSYQHQTCPRCSHPAGADERTCTRCGEALGGAMAHRARRLAGLVWAPGTPFVATVLTGAIVAIYATTLLWGRQVGLVDRVALSPHPLAFMRFGAMNTLEVTAGQWWELGTAMFLHLDPLHLIFNLMSLWSVTTYLEDVLGKSKTLALYLGLGFVASIVSYLWHANTPPYVSMSAGASGAICGLIGVCVGFSLRKRNVARHMVERYIGWTIWILILGLSSWRIDNAGHLGGLVPGLLAGCLVRRRSDTSAPMRRVWVTAAGVLVAVTIATIVIASGQSLPDEVLDVARAVTAAE